MKFVTTSLVSLLLGLSSSVLVKADHLDEDLFSFVPEDIAAASETCQLTSSDIETCPPTISIEQAACEAPLVVFGRVLQINRDENSEAYGAIQIQVEYKSRLFPNVKKTIPKYGAGLDNQVNGTAFYDDSGFFTTWVFGFLPPDTLVTDPQASCGTLVPRVQEELYFFLDNLPQDQGITGVDVDENTAELSVNLTLSETKFRSGTAPFESWDYIDEGIFNDEIKLGGDCQPVYCCYNMDCSGDCDGVLEQYPGYECPDWTIHEEGTDSGGRKSLFITALGILLLASPVMLL